MVMPPTPVRLESGPLGLYRYWPWIHLVIGGAILTAAAANWQWVVEHPRWLWFFVLPIPILALHEWEEFVFPGGFLEWFNRDICRSPDSRFPFTSQLATINHMPLMLLYPLLAALGTRWPWIGLSGLYGLLADCTFHVSGIGVSKRYSPGTVTALLLYVPLAFSATHYFVGAGEVPLAGLLASAFLGVIVFNLFLFLPPHLLAKSHARTLQPSPSGSSSSPR